VVESNDLAPNILAAETNECGTFIGNYLTNITSKPNEAERAAIEDRLRLAVEPGSRHQCNCAEQGRAHIINGVVDPAHSLVCDLFSGRFS
jgi:hypothetical protein